MIAAAPRRWLALAALLPLWGCGRSRARPAPSPRPIVVDAGRDSYIRRPRRVAPGCPALTGAAGEGSLHADTVAGAERWRADESPHRLPYGLHVHPGGSLVIEPCALLLVGPAMEVVVHGGATLRAQGATDRPVRFARLDPAQAWRSLELRPEARADSALDGVVLEGGGAAPGERGVVAATLRVGMTAGLAAEGLRIVGGEGWGVALSGDGRFARRDQVVAIEGMRGEGSVTVEDVNRVADLPRLALRDNASDEVRVEARVRTLTGDARWRPLAPGVRYRVRAAMHLLVEGASSPTLTLAAGTRIAFGEGAELDVGFAAPGALVAEGDPADPVVLEAAGAERWIGVHLGPRLEAGRTRLVGLRIAGAGAASGAVLPTCGCVGGHPDEAMLTLQGVEAPPTVRGLAFVDGPAAGFAVVVAGDLAGTAVLDAFARGASDFTRSGVRCATSAPYLRGACGPRSP